MHGWTLPLALVLVWLAAGVVVGWRLDRAGHPASTTASAVVAWPVLLSLLGAPPSVAVGLGPCADRIRMTFASLASALDDPAAGPVPWWDEVRALKGHLVAADARLGLVDRLLTDEFDLNDQAVAASREQLTEARRHAAAEIEAVLSGVVQLRLQVGLLTLADDALPVRDRLRELQARASALCEVSGLADTATEPTPGEL